MDKATKVAVEKYPHGTFDGELGDSIRAACAVGYMQAEKDLALTWEDINTIVAIAGSMLTGTAWDAIEWPDQQKYYEEVLKRFNEQRNDRDND